MVTVTAPSNLFSTDYYTEMHHTDATGISASDLAAAMQNRFFIEFTSAFPYNSGSGKTIIGTGTMSFTDGGAVQSNSVMDAQRAYAMVDDSAGHLESLAGGLYGIGDQNMTDDSTGTSYASAMISLIGVRCDSYENPIQEGSPVMGYFVVTDDGAGNARNLFFPTGDQDLSKMTLPAPGDAVPSDVSVVTHFDVFDGQPGNGYGYNYDYDANVGGTYISYVDLLPGNAVTGPTVPVDPTTDKIVSGTDGGELIDATYTGDNDGDLVDNDDGNPNSETGNDDSIVAGGGNDTINGGAGDDTMLGESGDDKFVLSGDTPGNDSIVGGETGETNGDCIDMSGLTTGVNIDMSTGNGESGTITFGDAGAVSGITSNGGTYFTPTDLFGPATTDGGNGLYQSSNPGNSGYSAMEHVQLDGKDYIVHAGNTAFEFWTMDPNSGQLTLENTISRSGDLQTNGFMSNFDIVTMNGETYAYCPNIYFTTILKYDSQAGAWAKIADLGSEITTPAGTIGANYGPSAVHTAPDGTVMSYSVLNGGGAGRIVTIEMDPNTGLPDTSTMKSFGPPSGVGTVRCVQVVNTDAGTLIITNDGNDA